MELALPAASLDEKPGSQSPQESNSIMAVALAFSGTSGLVCALGKRNGDIEFLP